MKTILAAVDGSASSIKAVDFAADLAMRCEAELVLLTVAIEIAPIFDAEFKAYARSEHIQTSASEIALAAAETVVADARIQAQSKGVRQISTEATFGDPARRIIDFATDR